MENRRGFYFRLRPVAWKILRRAQENFSIQEGRNIPTAEFLERLICEWAELHMPEQLDSIKQELRVT